MRHAILGAGAIGGFVGAVLANAGEEVTFVLRDESAGGFPLRLSLESSLGNIDAPVFQDLEATQCDLLWVAVKAPQLKSALLRAAPDLQCHAVIPLMNGIDHVSRLRRWFTAAPVVPGTIAVECERLAPGRVVHRSTYARMALSQRGEGFLSPTTDLFAQYGVSCSFVESETDLLWRKLAILAPIALATTATGLSLGEVLGNDEHRKLLEGSIYETCAVANALGAALDHEVILRAVRGVPGTMRSSMQKDLVARRPIELDAIAGPILRGGAEANVSVPSVATLHAVILSDLLGEPPRGSTSAAPSQH